MEESTYIGKMHRILSLLKMVFSLGVWSIIQRCRMSASLSVYWNWLCPDMIYSTKLWYVNNILKCFWNIQLRQPWTLMKKHSDCFDVSHCLVLLSSQLNSHSHNKKVKLDMYTAALGSRSSCSRDSYHPYSSSTEVCAALCDSCLKPNALETMPLVTKTQSPKKLDVTILFCTLLVLSLVHFAFGDNPDTDHW